MNFVVHEDLQDLAKFNKEIVYDIAMVAARETLKQVGADPKYLGAMVGGLVVLQTWAGDLAYHLHVHSLTAAGGLSLDGQSWIRWTRKRTPSGAVLGNLFHEKIIGMLKHAYGKGELRFPYSMWRMSEPKEFLAFLKELREKPGRAWIKRVPAGREVINRIRYLGRYVGRTAITDDRIIGIDEKSVTFLTRSPEREDAKEIKLPGEVFLRRFFDLLIPSGTNGIRHFGFLAPTKRSTEFVQCQEILEAESRWRPREVRRTEILPSRERAEASSSMSRVLSIVGGKEEDDPGTASGLRGDLHRSVLPKASA